MDSYPHMKADCLAPISTSTAKGAHGAYSPVPKSGRPIQQAVLALRFSSQLKTVHLSNTSGGPSSTLGKQNLQTCGKCLFWGGRWSEVLGAAVLGKSAGLSSLLFFYFSMKSKSQ